MVALEFFSASHTFCTFLTHTMKEYGSVKYSLICIQQNAERKPDSQSTGTGMLLYYDINPEVILNAQQHRTDVAKHSLRSPRSTGNNLAKK